MKKYIRTEDGRILESEINDNRASLGYKIIPFVKQANNIEVLADEFRGIWLNYYESEKKDAHEEYHYDKEKHVFYDDFEELTYKEAIEKFDIFYAAIWTDRGLIYVAKAKGILPNGEIDWESL